VNLDDLKYQIHHRRLNRTGKLLTCLAMDGKPTKTVAEIKKIALSAGLREVNRWNISDLLRKSNGRAIRTQNGWELAPDARPTANGTGSGGQIAALNELRSNLVRLRNSGSKSFVEEAIACLEHHLYRSAVVLSWVGAIALLYEHVIGNRIADFNSEALRRAPKWKRAVTPDDLARMKEVDFLDTLEAISAIGKSVKKQLQHCLDLRNGCGHPNSLAIGGSIAAAHVQILVLNVFAKF